MRERRSRFFWVRQALGLAVVWGLSIAAQTPAAVAHDCDNLPPNVTRDGTEFTVRPTGGDDTQSMQLAVDCATQLPWSTVTLAPGQFRWTQIVAQGWEDGRFVGAGADFGLAGAGDPPYANHTKDLERYTYIDALGPNSVPIFPPDCNPPTAPDYDPWNPEWDPNDPDCLDFIPSEGEPYPPGTAALFVIQGGGDVEVAHLTWEITPPEPARWHRAVHGFEDYPVLDYIMLVTNRPPSLASSDEGVWVHDVIFKSLSDHPDIPFGENVRVGLTMDGLMITPGVYVPGDTGMVTATPFTGSYLVENCVFDGQGILTEAGGLVGGSVTWRHNRFLNGAFGVLFLDHDDSVFIIEDNEFANQEMYSIAAWQRRGAPPVDRTPGFRVPDEPAVFAIHDNHISGAWDTGMDITDFGGWLGQTRENLVGEVYDNEVLAPDGGWAGIGVFGVAGSMSLADNRVDGSFGSGFVLYNTDGVEMDDNRVAGTGGNAVWVIFSNECEIAETNVRGWFGELDVLLEESTDCEVEDSGEVTVYP